MESGRGKSIPKQQEIVDSAQQEDFFPWRICFGHGIILLCLFLDIFSQSVLQVWG